MEQRQVTGGQLVETISRLLEEGNVRRIVIKQGDRTLVEFPLTVGLVGAALAPVVAAAGALAAVLAECTIEVERATPAAADPTAAELDAPR
jgi:uncharacterized protein DUF4342